MTLKEMIYHRASCRKYTNTPVDTETIQKILSFQPQPLHPHIQYRIELVDRNSVKCICPWTTQQLLTFYSEKTEGWLENAGFLLQQMDLFIQSLGLGTCWLGMGRMNAQNAPVITGMEYVIMLAFGVPKEDPFRQSTSQFKRKDLTQISDEPDILLEPARLAPSSTNSQPWYFTHENGMIHLFCKEKRLSSYMNRIDVGIALAHLFIAYEDSIRFTVTTPAPVLQNHQYILSLNI